MTTIREMNAQECSGSATRSPGPQPERFRLYDLLREMKRGAADAEAARKAADALEWLLDHVVPTQPPEGTFDRIAALLTRGR